VNNFLIAQGMKLLFMVVFAKKTVIGTGPDPAGIRIAWVFKHREEYFLCRIRYPNYRLDLKP
jgi:hypothetical protein